MRLFIKFPGGELKEIELERKGYIVGRAEECDIVIPDPRVSSRHFFLTPRGGEWWIRDLGSTNGTFLNGRKISVSKITEGDTLRVGQTLITVGKKELKEITRSLTLQTTRMETLLAPPCSLDEAMRLHRHLEILCKVSKILHSVQTLEEALEKTLDLIFQVLKADRGVIFLKGDEGFKKVAERRSEDDRSPLRISFTIVEEVFKKGESVITSDAMQDERFRNRKSVISSHIHSAMCVPLVGKENILGVIYTDTLLSKGAFKSEDLELLTIIGHQAGMAIENARLYEENLKKERLAGIGMAVAGMAHYIKNIIQGIKGGETLVDVGITQKKPLLLERGWDVVKKALRKVEDLVLNMLTYSKEREPVKNPVLLNELLEEVRQLFSERAKERGIILKGVYDPEVKTMMVDPMGIHRALTNLIINAIDAIGENGEIVISSQKIEEGVEIRVKDNGRGIPPEMLSHLFTPFTSSKGMEGTGLGLAVTKKIVDEHKGEIRVESEVGKGTTFIISLPAQ